MLIDSMVDAYLAMWHEPDSRVRAESLEKWWAPSATHLLQPPAELRDRGSALGMEATFTARGHPQLLDRVSHAYEEFVATGEFLFRLHGTGARIDDAVYFRWEMIKRDDGGVAARGVEFLVLDEYGRIRLDYQFIE